MSCLITKREFRARLSVGEKKFEQLRKTDPAFPAASQLSAPNKLLWLDDDANKYIRKRGRASPTKPAASNQHSAANLPKAGPRSRRARRTTHEQPAP